MMKLGNKRLEIVDLKKLNKVERQIYFMSKKNKNLIVAN